MSAGLAASCAATAPFPQRVRSCGRGERVGASAGADCIPSSVRTQRLMRTSGGPASLPNVTTGGAATAAMAACPTAGAAAAQGGGRLAGALPRRGQRLAGCADHRPPSQQRSEGRAGRRVRTVWCPARYSCRPTACSSHPFTAAAHPPPRTRPAAVTHAGRALPSERPLTLAPVAHDIPPFPPVPMRVRLSPSQIRDPRAPNRYAGARP